jgi:hypothetical protein
MKAVMVPGPGGTTTIDIEHPRTGPPGVRYLRPHASGFAS